MILNASIVIGMDKTIQRGDLGKRGILFKLVPMHAEMKPSDDTFTSCWYRALPTWLPRAGQSIIPTKLSDFKVKEGNDQMSLMQSAMIMFEGIA